MSDNYPHRYKSPFVFLFGKGGVFKNAVPVNEFAKKYGWWPDHGGSKHLIPYIEILAVEPADLAAGWEPVRKVVYGFYDDSDLPTDAEVRACMHTLRAVYKAADAILPRTPNSVLGLTPVPQAYVKGQSVMIGPYNLPVGSEVLSITAEDTDLDGWGVTNFVFGEQNLISPEGSMYRASLGSFLKSGVLPFAGCRTKEFMQVTVTLACLKDAARFGGISLGLWCEEAVCRAHPYVEPASPSLRAHNS